MGCYNFIPNSSQVIHFSCIKSFQLQINRSPPTVETPSLPPETPVSVSPTDLDGGFTSGFTLPQAFGLAFLEPCRIPLRVPDALAEMGGVQAAPDADAQFSSRRRPARSRASFSLIKVSSRTHTF
jgi:hypothetical protein